MPLSASSKTKWNNARLAMIMALLHGRHKRAAGKVVWSSRHCLALERVRYERMAVCCRSLLYGARTWQSYSYSYMQKYNHRMYSTHPSPQSACLPSIVAYC
jgi:hypothetical protein